MGEKFMADANPELDAINTELKKAFPEEVAGGPVDLADAEAFANAVGFKGDINAGEDIK